MAFDDDGPAGLRSGDGEVEYRRPLTLPEQIAEQVSDAILKGRYRPGDPVREQDLADKFQVSRGPIREALRLLEMEGVVRIAPNRGAHVTRLTTDEVRDIFEIRAALSQVAVGHLCAAGTPEVIAAFKAGAARLQELAQDPEGHEDYVRQSAALSRILASITHNRRLTGMLHSLARQTIRYTQLGLATQARRRESAHIWRQVVDAVAAGDATNAGRHVNRLIMDSRDAAIAAIEQEEAAAAVPPARARR